MAYEVWAYDLFDRQSERSSEGRGLDDIAGCALLWQRTVTQGVGSDGRCTFHAFELELSRARLAIPIEPFEDAAVRRLCQWIDTPGVLFALGKRLAEEPTQQTAARCLAHVAEAADAYDLCARLGTPVDQRDSRRQLLCERGDELEALLGSDAAGLARFLIIKGPEISHRSLLALARSERLDMVEHLSIARAPCSDEFMALLARSRLPRLRSLSLVSCGVTDGGVASLATSSWAFGLKALVLSNQADGPPNTIGDPGAMTLANEHGLKNLERLDLGFNPVGDAGAAALLSSVWMTSLAELVLWRTGLTQAGATACARATSLRESRGATFCVVHSDYTPREIRY